MSHVHSPEDMLNILRDIQHRSQLSASKISQSESHGFWTGIGFRVAQHHLLIPLQETREVFTVPSQITQVPKSQPWVFGIANLRGELLPLFDLKYFLYGQPTQVNKRSRIVVNNHPELYSGLLLDEVFGLKHFQQEPDATITLKDESLAKYITGHIKQQEQHWDVFSFNQLAADHRFLNAAA